MKVHFPELKRRIRKHMAGISAIAPANLQSIYLIIDEYEDELDQQDQEESTYIQQSKGKITAQELDQFCITYTKLTGRMK